MEQILLEKYSESSDSEDSDFSPSQDTSSSEEEETVEVNGIQVHASQKKMVREMFEKYPDLTSDFDLKNQQLKNAYMDVLIDLTETLCHSEIELSLEDLDKAEKTLSDLTRAGLKVGWLREKLDEAYLTKEKQRISAARIRELEEQVEKQKLTLSGLKSDLQKERSAALASGFGY